MKKLLLVILGFVLGVSATYYFCNKESDGVTETKPLGYISSDAAKKLSSAYNSRYELISKVIVTREGGDNRSSWYSLDDMYAYLSIAEKEASNSGYKMDGIRIYLGAYPEEKGVPGYTTMFFAPTGTSVDSETSMSPKSVQIRPSGDIPGVGCFNKGTLGDPPSSVYPH